jgi:glycerate 2-kinase
MAHQPLTNLARSIFAHALGACDVGAAFGRHVWARPGSIEVRGALVDVSRYREVRVAAVGKAADAMMACAAPMLDGSGLGGAPRRGLIVAHTLESTAPPPWAGHIVGGHPIPDARSLEAGRRLLELFDGCTPQTLAVFLFSGGGSALAEWPLDPRLSVEDVAAVNELLVRSGLPIRSINAVRKHLSAIKGGRLAAHAAPAGQLTLLVSDVAPGDLQSIASGPTIADETTVADVTGVLDGHGLRDRLPPLVRDALAPGALVETPKPADLAHLRTWVVPLLDCSDAAIEAAREARRHAAAVELFEPGDGPLEEIVDGHLSALERLLHSNAGRLCAVVSAGEVTLEVTGSGLGGRNQQTVLAALVRARELCPSAREVALLSAGTDGRDGPTDAAGAVAGLEALAEAAVRGLEPGVFLRYNDAYNFFDPLGALIRTGPTGTNVRDVRVFLGR